MRPAYFAFLTPEEELLITTSKHLHSSLSSLRAEQDNTWTKIMLDRLRKIFNAPKSEEIN